jgi:hypothetical protein
MMGGGKEGKKEGRKANKWLRWRGCTTRIAVVARK